MRMLFLGTGGSAPTPDRNTPALYLPEHGILLDAGTNVFPLRHLHGDGPLTVLMSHYHLDHSIGLFTLAAGMFHGRSRPDIRVFGPEWDDRFRGTCGAESPLFPIPLPFPIEQAPDRFRIGNVDVEIRGVPHTAPVVAYRLTFPDGTTLAYVTDTTAPGDYADFVRGVDVLVHECTFSRANAEWSDITGHSDTDHVAQVARDTGVGALYLTHTGPLENRIRLLREVRETFPNTVLPVEGLEYPRAESVDPRRAVFPGSFDPLTVSHLDIIHASVETFLETHVLVARNPAKDHSALFTPEERVDLIRRCVPSTVSVSVWGGLTVDYARHVQAGRIVRGLGRAEDYTVEVRLWKTNALLAPEIQTVWLPPQAQNLEVSSSMVKEAARFGGWDRVAHLVPEPIRELVGERIRSQPPVTG